MSTLQISLAMAGGVVLAGIVAHSAWTTWRNTPKQPEPETPDESAVRDANEARTEPAFEGDAPLPPLDAGSALEPGIDADHFAATRPAPLPKNPVGLDPLIDVIAPIPLEKPVSGDTVLAALPATRRVGTKPFAVEGFNPATDHWEPAAAGQHYNALQAGVQLANRTGALNDIEFSEFVMKAQTFADALGGTPDFPDMRHEVARARELDQFANDHDAQLTFMLRARAAAWSPGYLEQNASRVGFTAGTIPGRMNLPAVGQPVPGWPPVLTLAFDTRAALSEDPEHTAIREFTLNLDVAHVRRDENAFTRLREVAATLATAMDGVLTDQNGQVLPEGALEGIGADLEKLYDMLEGRDLAAGSLLARRLFS